jgi:1,3-beta-glucanosyltransferase GAS3
MQRLGINTIRVYNLDPSLDHQACASIFNAAGIYMILDVNSPLPNQSLNRGAPWESYNSGYMERVFQVVEAFHNFNNTLGFFSGNEVINQDSVIEVPGYIRAVTRDIKDFIAARSPRTIPVGYSAADVDTLLSDTWNYLGCEISNSTSSKIDFFGLNSYSWCGNSSFTDSGYDQLVSQFSNTTIPVFFSEYGCNTISPRVFSEVPALYGPQMIGVMSGGLVYEYSEEPNNYGLVALNDNNTVSILQDYDNLRTEYDLLNLSLLEKSNATATSLTPPTCDPDLITGDDFETDFDIPARVSGIDEFITNGVSGSYPKAFSQVTDIKPSQVVYDVNGQELQGLQLTILAGDQSNLPGNNTSGTSPSASSTTSSSSSPTATKNAAVKGGEVKVGAMVMGGLTVGFLLKL